MITSCILLAMFHLGGVQKEMPSAADVAERELRKRGVRFKDVSLYALFLNPDATRDELVRLGQGNIHIVVDDSQKLGRDPFKWLRDLPHLKEIVLGPEFPDEWCKELEPLSQLEGLFLMGNFNFGQGVTDRGIASFAKFRNLQALSLAHSKVTDEGLRHIAGLTKLRWLSLGGAQNVTNKGLVHLKGLKNLQDLTIEATRTTSEGLVHLQGLTKMRRLRLPNEMQAQEQAVGLKYLAKMTELYMLDARGLCAGDDDLRVVRNMTKLEDLNLCYTKVTDKGLEHLAGLTELKELDLFGTGVTGDGLKHLRNLKKLKSLVLGFCPLRDAAAEHLRHMTHLEYLEVGDTGMTKKAIEELQRQLPKTKVQ